jgi:hypothetical protein
MKMETPLCTKLLKCIEGEGSEGAITRWKVCCSGCSSTRQPSLGKQLVPELRPQGSQAKANFRPQAIRRYFWPLTSNPPNRSARVWRDALAVTSSSSVLHSPIPLQTPKLRCAPIAVRRLCRTCRLSIDTFRTAGSLGSLFNPSIALRMSSQPLLQTSPGKIILCPRSHLRSHRRANLKSQNPADS